MDDGALQVIAQWGPLWLLAILTAWFLLPKLGDVITRVGDARIEQHKLDGRILEALQHNSSVIDNNTAALRAVTSLSEREDDQIRLLATMLSRVQDELREHDERAANIHTEQRIINTRVGGTL